MAVERLPDLRAGSGERQRGLAADLRADLLARPVDGLPSLPRAGGESLRSDVGGADGFEVGRQLSFDLLELGVCALKAAPLALGDREPRQLRECDPLNVAVDQRCGDRSGL